MKNPCPYFLRTKAEKEELLNVLTVRCGRVVECLDCVSELIRAQTAHISPPPRLGYL